eukprot:3818683-Pyramimonas_sp.AAC.1
MADACMGRSLAFGSPPGLVELRVDLLAVNHRGGAGTGAGDQVDRTNSLRAGAFIGDRVAKTET